MIPSLKRDVLGDNKHISYIFTGTSTYVSMQDTFTVFFEAGMFSSGGGLGAVRNSSAMITSCGTQSIHKDKLAFELRAIKKSMNCARHHLE